MNNRSQIGKNNTEVIMLRRRFYKDKTFMIILLVCLIAATAIAIGSVAINRNNNNNENLVDLNEDEDVKQPVDSQVEKQTQQDTQSNTEPTYNDVSSIDIKDAEASNFASSLNFTTSSVLFWPIEGNVILDFNMENTIYFPTLDKYQCNPAIIIQGDIDTPVLSAADCVVKEINEDEELGNSIVVSLGNNFEITYGQLKSIQVKKGQAIKAKDIIAYVNEPTKYYSIEGNNLYFMLTKDGEPIDPLNYLSY